MKREGSDSVTLLLRRSWSRLVFVMHAVPALLLIVSLLICPYRCLGSSRVDSAPEEEKVSGCPCCQHHAAEKATDPDSSPGDSSPGDQESSTPEDDCNCGSCLCHGALRGDGGSTQDLLQAASEIADMSAVMLPVVIHPTGEWAAGPPVSASAAGRPLRLTLHSLQI